MFFDKVQNISLVFQFLIFKRMASFSNIVSNTTGVKAESEQDRARFLAGLLAGFSISDLFILGSLLQMEHQRRALAIQNAQVREPPATPIDQNKPLPPVGAKPKPTAAQGQQQKKKYWKPFDGSAAIRITDDEKCATLEYENVGNDIRELLRPLKVKRLVKDKKTKQDRILEKPVQIKFFFVDIPDQDDLSKNRTLIVFPQGCMDFCQAALPVIKKHYPSAEIYTGPTESGQWE